MQVLCTFGIKMLDFFWVYAGLVCLVKIMHFLPFMQVLERYKSQNLQRVCNFEVNKAQIKTGIRFWCSFFLILLKTSNHQNKTNRVCIKHRNLQCFVSMSFNVFNAILGSDTFPPSRGRPWGGGGYHIYIYIYIFKGYAHAVEPGMCGEVKKGVLVGDLMCLCCACSGRVPARVVVRKTCRQERVRACAEVQGGRQQQQQQQQEEEEQQSQQSQHQPSSNNKR